MAIAIEITDKVSGSVETKIAGIGTAARLAHKAVEELKSVLSSINSSALSQLTQAATSGVSQLNTASNQAATSVQTLAAAQSKAAEAAQRVATETQRTAVATANAASAQQRASTNAQKLATEQQRTAKETANAAAAADKAALAQLRLAQAQEKAAQAAKKQADGMSRLQQFLLSLGAAAGAVGILKLADGYTTLQNKLQNVADSQGQVNTLTDRMYELANRTRTDIDATATSFTRFDRALKAMGKSQEETFRMTETVNKGLIVSGATATEAASTLLQLSQAFNAGKLQGDEFRSLAENFPMIMDAVAQSMGKPINEIKELASQGKITSRVMFDALQLIEKKVDETFAKTTPTIAQAGVVLKNSMSQAFGELNKSLGITAAMATAILVLADNMDVLIPVVAGLGVALLVAFGPRLLAAFSAAIAAARAFTLALLANPVVAIAAALVTLATAIGMYVEKTKHATTETAIFRDYVMATITYLSDAWDKFSKFIGDAWDSAMKWISKQLEGWGTSITEVMQIVGNGIKQYANLGMQAWAAAYETVSYIWSNFPALMKNFFVAVYNFSAQIVESVVNSWQSGMKLIADSIENFAPEAAKGIREVLEATRLELSRMEYDQGGLQATQNYMDKMKDIFSRDLVGEWVGDWTGRVDKETQDRLKAAAANANNLRGAGDDLTGSPQGKPGSNRDAKRYKFADAEREMQREIQLLKMTRQERELLLALDQMEDRLGKDKNGNRITFNATQKETLTGLIQERDLLQNMVSLHEEMNGPMLRYNETQAALNGLLANGAISAEQYANKMRDLDIAVLETQTSMEAGFSRGLLKAQKDMTDLSKLTEDFTTKTIVGLEDSLVSLATTGSANFKKLAQSIVQDLIRIMVRALITRALLMAIGSIGGGMGGAATTSAMGSASGMGGSLESFMGGGSGTAVQQFSKGGWTGNKSKSDVAGIVHGQEFVVKAGAAESNRELLEAMNQGARFTMAPSAPVGTSVPTMPTMPAMQAQGSGRPGVVVNVNNTQKDRVNVAVEEEQQADGTTKINVLVDMVENQLAGRMNQGRGPLYNSTRTAFGLNANPKGQ